MTRKSSHHRFQEVLVLDGSYIPMDSFPRRKAIRAVVNGRAQILDLRSWSRLSDRESFLGTFQAIVFPRARAVSDAKLGYGRGNKAILRRDGYQCQFVGCNRRATTVDHVVPRCQGGPTSWANLVASCLECNQKKGGRTPDQAGMALKRPVHSRKADLFERLRLLAMPA